MASVEYINISPTEIEVGAPLLSSLAVRFRDNAVGIFQRAPGAPRMNAIGRLQKLTGSGTWTVPADVYHLKVTYSGGGGGGADTDGDGGSNGGATSFGGLPNASGGAGGNEFLGSVSQSSSSSIGAQGGLGSRASNGLPGQLRVRHLSVSPGDSISYSCGAGGAGDSGASPSNLPSDGTNGFIYIEY